LLINADVKGLEVVTAAQLSEDKVLADEIIRKVDTHADNQKQFRLPDRVTAKRFIFKLLYGATAYGYSTDSDFIGVGYDQKQWQEVIDKFYNKYRGIHAWHKRLIYEAQSTGRIGIPSGRYYPISPDYKKREPWPLTIIKNYPVQGFGADLVMLARLRANQLLEQSGLEALLVCTIHDSIVADCPTGNVGAVGRILKQAVEEVPGLVKEIWNYNFVLPLTAEVQYGPNKADMQELDF